MKEAIEALHQRIKDLAASSTPDQLAYLAKSLELIADKKAIFNVNVVQMTTIKEIIDALQKRLKDLAANSTPDQLAYLAKALESIVDKSAVSDIVQMTDGKLKELLDSAKKHLSDINSNKATSISSITAAKTDSVNEINKLRDNSLNTLKASSDSHISLLDTRKNANIAAINSISNSHKDGLKGLVEDFRAITTGSSIIGEIETRDEQLKVSLINEMKTRNEQLKASTINEVKTRNEQLKNTFEIISDPEILLKTINENDLETWLSSTDNHKKFDKMLNNANAVLNITGNPSALSKLVESPKAIQALIKSNVALNIIANTVAVNILVNSDNTSVNSSAALHVIVQSEVACKVIENGIQNYRSTVVSTLEASSSLFRKQTGIKVGDGATSTRESGRGSATIYVPVSCRDDGDTDFSVNSLLTGNRLAYIARHRGETSVSSGIALRGVQVRGEGGSAGEVTFDVYTAI